jgi:hypothetical protein
MTTSDILLRDILATTIHNVEGVECSHVDYKQPSCERDADALVGEVKRYAHEKSIEALTEFHNTTFQDVSTRDDPAGVQAAEVLNTLAVHIKSLFARGPSAD